LPINRTEERMGTNGTSTKEPKQRGGSWWTKVFSGKVRPRKKKALQKERSEVKSTREKKKKMSREEQKGSATKTSPEACPKKNTVGRQKTEKTGTGKKRGRESCGVRQ